MGLATTGQKLIFILELSMTAKSTIMQRTPQKQYQLALKTKSPSMWIVKTTFGFQMNLASTN
ncbi:hypothetical protein [Liquorilactobacillus hordei]|uniref:hypothetical protein n=1 Tax=Liquorilactobacillus hordei TaxID=468911 RepID=UPI00070F010B|nr:hypothetical protein [Liquorilactobacillus hordei]